MRPMKHSKSPSGSHTTRKLKENIELTDFSASKPMRRKDEEKRDSKSKLWEQIMAQTEEDKGSSSDDDDQV